jgi:hypothetical protein
MVDTVAAFSADIRGFAKAKLQASSAQALAATSAACIQHLAAILGCHAGAEPVTALANQVRRLKCTLHCGFSIPWPLRSDSRGQCYSKPGL